MLRNIYRLSVILILSLIASASYAAYDDLDNPPDLFCQPGKTAGNNPAFGGKPISLFSGMETFAPSTDLTLGTLFPIRVTRSYNSRTSYDSPLGYGWAINYDKRLYTYADNSITVRRECGGKKRFTFVSIPQPGYVGQTGDTGTLVQNTDGYYIYTDKYGESEKYDPQGRLISMADAKGNSLVFTYNSTLRELLRGLLPFNLDQSKTDYIVAYDYHLSKIEEYATGNPTGKYVDLHYDSNGRLTDITDGSRTVSYGHDTFGNLTTASGPNGNSIYGYTDPYDRKHLLTNIDEGNGEYTNEYEAGTGRVKKQKHGTGEIDFDYTIPYQKTTMTTYIRDGANTLNTQTRTVEFDSNGMAIKVTDTFGNVTTYVRDNNTTWILEEGRLDIATGITTTIAYDYDGKGNMLTKTEALGTTVEKTTSYTYDPVYSLVTTETVSSVVNSDLVSTTTNSYDPSNGNLLSRVESGYLGNGAPYTYTTNYDYYSNGKLKSIDGPRDGDSDKTTYTYDPTTGYLTSVTQPIIGITLYSDFDNLGNPRTVKDANLNETFYTYDDIGRVKTVKAPGDTSLTQYFYVSGGCQTCGGGNKIDYILLSEGNKIDYDYDAMGNLEFIKDNLGNYINYNYDSEGNKLNEQIKDFGNWLQKSLGYTYDALNRLKRIINPDTNYTEYTYYASGSRRTAKDPNNNETSYNYDELGRLKTVSQPGTVNTIYGYDTNNSLTSVKDAKNNSTTYKYDDKGRVYQVISPDTGTTTYTYDAAGNMTHKVDAKLAATQQQITYVYDALNRLTHIYFPNDAVIVYTYDTPCQNGKGRLCKMEDASGTTTYRYSAKGQVVEESKTIYGVSGNPYVTGYSYDQNGNIKTITYPSGKVITYIYDNNRVKEVKNGASFIASGVGYYPFGPMKAITYGNNLTGAMQYDTQYRATDITIAPVMHYQYDLYDNNGNIKNIKNLLDQTRNRSYTYDALDRLDYATSTGLWGALDWDYDSVGNRTKENLNDYIYPANSNKLSFANGKSYGYDANGNTTGEGSRIFGYNDNQRLISVSDAGASYTYNGNGQRAKKVVNGVTTIYHYSLNGQIIAESNSAGNMTAEYVYLNEQPLAKIEGTNTYYYHNDHLATPQKMTDSSGTVVWAADYKPFGEATVTVSTITNNLRFPGQYYDAETGLNYNYFRDYNPVIGRYVQADEVGIVYGTNHLYVYAENNPITMIDPNGLGTIGCIKSMFSCGGKCAKETKECKEKHKDILTCFDRGETIRGGSASIHLLDECYWNSPACQKCVKDLINCYNYVPGTLQVIKQAKEALKK